MAAILGDKLIKATTRGTMWTAQHTSDGKSSNYGLGWGVSEKLGTRLIAHGGAQQGTSTFLLLVPDRRAAVIVLANMHSVNVSGLAEEMLRVPLGLNPTNP